ncbi:MAG: lipid IV(A) 4-amino-4-deoxy-L-arabinosyltransferase [Wigglesworthia glossinidia]|nr:lipid IV(A) 4-amino-4-deoxy-L-arabinosyltransferase [Wigglesworthia glossinidia]
MQINSKKIIIFLTLLYYLIPLNHRDLWQPDETRYAEISREMLKNQNWSIPYLLDVRYFEKPVFGYWINNISQLIFGKNNFSVRFGSTFFTFLSAIFLFYFVQNLWKNRDLSYSTVIIFSSNLLVYIIGTYSVLDAIVSFWINASMVFFWMAIQSYKIKKYQIFYYLISGITCGIGFMTKGFIAFVIPFLSIFTWLMFNPKYIKTVLLHSLISLIMAILIVFPWMYGVVSTEKDYFRYFIFIEHIQRFLGDNAQHKASFWYYVPVIFIGILPWFGFIFKALYKSWILRKIDKISFYFLIWIVVQFLFFSISKGKLPTYILPCFFPISILIAKNIFSNSLKKNEILLKKNALLNIVFGFFILLIISTLYFVPNLYHFNLYSYREYNKFILFVISILIWILINIWIGYFRIKHWRWTAMSVVGIAILFGFYVPDRIVYSKQPQIFLDEISQYLKKSDFIVTNNIGLATSIAWQINRSDIIIFDKKGELEYGLSYSNSLHDRFIEKNNFNTWFNQNKNKSIALILLTPTSNSLDYLKKNFPNPKHMIKREKMVLLKY